jgi:hypothetical protein
MLLVVWSLLLAPLVRENHFQAPPVVVVMYAALTPRELAWARVSQPLASLPLVCQVSKAVVGP